jgi:hypothetical protein
VRTDEKTQHRALVAFVDRRDAPQRVLVLREETTGDPPHVLDARRDRRVHVVIAARREEGRDVGTAFVTREIPSRGRGPRAVHQTVDGEWHALDLQDGVALDASRTDDAAVARSDQTFAEGARAGAKTAQEEVGERLEATILEVGEIDLIPLHPGGDRGVHRPSRAPQARHELRGAIDRGVRQRGIQTKEPLGTQHAQDATLRRLRSHHAIGVPAAVRRQNQSCTRVVVRVR